MAIKDFLIKDSYSRIERIDVMKETSTVDFYLTVYKNDSMKDVVLKDMRFSYINNDMAEPCSCSGGVVETLNSSGDIIQTPCEICIGTGYIPQRNYDDFFKDALKSDINILSICYNILKSKPEFANTTEV